MNDNKKVDIKKLNELIKTGNILLKISLAMFILSIVLLFVYILDKTSILSVIGNFFNVLSPLFIGLVISWLLEPFINYFHKNKVNRTLSAVSVYLILIFVVSLIIALIVPEFISQVNELINKIPELSKSITEYITNISINLKTAGIDASLLKDNLIKSFNSFVSDFSANNIFDIIAKLGSSLKVLANILIGLLIAFYLSLDFSKVKKYYYIIVPNRFHDGLSKLGTSLNNMLRSYVKGTLLSCLFVMILSLIGFVISGISSPLLFAIFCAITNLIPYFGPYIGGIPVIMVGFAISPSVGIGCLITVLIVQILEGNILNPIIVGKAVSLHPITMMLSLLVFEYFFGIPGMIFAAPVVATFKIILLYFEDKYNFINKIKDN